MPHLSDQWCAGSPGELPALAENLPHMSILAQAVAPSAATACSLNLDLLNVFSSAPEHLIHSYFGPLGKDSVLFFVSQAEH